MRHAARRLPHAALAAWGLAWMIMTGMGARVGAPSSVAPTLEMLQPKMNQELPKGSTVERVLAFLKSNRVEHSGLLTPEQAIFADVANTPDAKFSTDKVQLQFWFHQDRLVVINVRELYD